MYLFRFFSFVLLVGLGACTGQKKITNNYLLNATDTTQKTFINITEPSIQKNDLLSIKVYSASLDRSVDVPYNFPEAGGSANSGGGAATGVLVDAKGDIEYPQIGIIHAEGLKKNELAGLIKAKLENVLKNPSVIIRFLNYRITVLGEVKAPNTFTIPTERVTILEALGLAGDITDFGNKNTVKIAREKGEQLEIGSIDLTSKDLFNSPYYRLQQNDVVFVEQTRRKVQQQQQQTVAQQIGIATGIVTGLALLLNLIK